MASYATALSSSATCGKRPCILVVEDEAGLLEIIAVNLEASGFDVLRAADGVTGWRAFEEHLPDLVVLDINLPGISGFRLMELFRQAGPVHVPVLALTALDFAEAEDLVRHDLDAFMSKPFQPMELIANVHHLLSQRTETEDGGAFGMGASEEKDARRS